MNVSVLFSKLFSIEQIAVRCWADFVWNCAFICWIQFGLHSRKVRVYSIYIGRRKPGTGKTTACATVGELYGCDRSLNPLFLDDVSPSALNSLEHQVVSVPKMYVLC